MAQNQVYQSTCVCILMCVCVSLYVFVCLHVHSYGCVYVYVYPCVYIYVYLALHMPLCIWVYAFMLVCVCVCRLWESMCVSIWRAEHVYVSVGLCMWEDLKKMKKGQVTSLKALLSINR